MFYVLLHTLNSFLSALSIGEMVFGFEFELHAYMTFATTYLLYTYGKVPIYVLNITKGYLTLMFSTNSNLDYPKTANQIES